MSNLFNWRLGTKCRVCGAVLEYDAASKSADGKFVFPTHADLKICDANILQEIKARKATEPSPKPEPPPLSPTVPDARPRNLLPQEWEPTKADLERIKRKMRDPIQPTIEDLYEAVADMAEAQQDLHEYILRHLTGGGST